MLAHLVANPVSVVTGRRDCENDRLRPRSHPIFELIPEPAMRPSMELVDDPGVRI